MREREISLERGGCSVGADKWVGMWVGEGGVVRDRPLDPTFRVTKLKVLNFSAPTDFYFRRVIFFLKSLPMRTSGCNQFSRREAGQGSK